MCPSIVNILYIFRLSIRDDELDFTPKIFGYYYNLYFIILAYTHFTIFKFG